MDDRRHRPRPCPTSRDIKASVGPSQAVKSLNPGADSVSRVWSVYMNGRATRYIRQYGGTRVHCDVAGRPSSRLQSRAARRFNGNHGRSVGPWTPLGLPLHITRPSVHASDAACRHARARAKPRQRWVVGGSVDLILGTDRSRRTLARDQAARGCDRASETVWWRRAADGQERGRLLLLRT